MTFLDVANAAPYKITESLIMYTEIRGFFDSLISSRMAIRESL